MTEAYVLVQPMSTDKGGVTHIAAWNTSRRIYEIVATFESQWLAHDYLRKVID